MTRRIAFLSQIIAITLFAGCGGSHEGAVSSGEEPEFLEVGENMAVSVSPFDGSRDTLRIDRPIGRVIVMSTSYIGFLDAIGCDSVICGVSGLNFVNSAKLLERKNSVLDVGFEAAPDYEKIVSLHPDLLINYEVSGARSPFEARLKSLGIRVFDLHEHLETHPIARAAYIRFFGAITGRLSEADSVLAGITERYNHLADSVRTSSHRHRKLLVNIPYNDQWFIPGAENYLSRLVRDAGGEILGAEKGQKLSSTISIEDAYRLSKDADLWMNVSWCQSMDQLLGINPLFRNMYSNIQANASARGFDPASVVWNDNLRQNAMGGNDFWESGPVHPDLILKDLVSIFSDDEAPTHYYRRLD